VVWHARVAIEGQGQVSVALDRLLSDVPQHRIARPSVRLALGFAHSHIKRIEGLPPARQLKILDRIVKENADAFFLRLGARTLVSDVDRRPDGTTWAAGFDGTLLDDVLGVLRRHRLSPQVVLPFAAAAAQATPPGVWRVSDGRLEAELTTIEGGTVGACRRALPGSRPIESTTPVIAALDACGSDGLDLIGAYGAATSPVQTAFAWRPAPNPARVRVLRLAGATAAAMLFSGSLGAALLARGVHAARISSTAAIELATFRDSQTNAARIDAELRKVTAELDRVHQFDASRGRISMLLGALSEALPDSTAMVSLRIDSLEGNFVALTPHAADVLPQLFEVPDVVAPRIIGSVTREVLGVAHVERAAIRFRRTLPARGTAR
jgi:hypothetical protein